MNDASYNHLVSFSFTTCKGVWPAILLPLPPLTSPVGGGGGGEGGGARWEFDFCHQEWLFEALEEVVCLGFDKHYITEHSNNESIL